MKKINNKESKEITLSDLAQIMTEGFAKSENKTDEKIESLARTIQENFLSMSERFDGVEKRLDTIETNLNKKVDKLDHNTLSYRVEKLEKKFA